jgi:hypothetical protein
MALARRVFEGGEQCACNPLTSGGRDHGEPLDGQMIDGVLKTNRSYRRVASPRQHRSTFIQGACYNSEGLTVNPRRWGQHPAVLAISRLGDAVDKRCVFTCRTGEANVARSHSPLHLRLMIIRLLKEARQHGFSAIVWITPWMRPMSEQRLVANARRSDGHAMGGCVSRGRSLSWGLMHAMDRRTIPCMAAGAAGIPLAEACESPGVHAGGMAGLGGRT